ncbi:hypothetical protein KEF85_09620 [Methylomonas paludis]|uniref:Uncharacterized protein n=1 Tax=Methylomonas paludis TaxID=1173101 RepID=A0A975R7U6_9GAMM|nr:hypothetical protein [Methylomonas paludis]QWF69635.1 hypothetical protein KEF85_09620 [Methylomonas paludis]
MPQSSIFWRLKWLTALLLLTVLDISPVPVSSLLLLYVFLLRPFWFKKLIERLYTGR